MARVVRQLSAKQQNGDSNSSVTSIFILYLLNMELNESYKNRLQELGGVKTDCREEIGIKVGLIDSIITEKKIRFQRSQRSI